NRLRCIRSLERAAEVESGKRTDAQHEIRNWRSQMTLMKSILLGSAAGIVAVGAAQAADLPTRKAAPVEYVRVCNVGGITGWTLPGSDTCMKVSGYITGQFEGGNLNTQYNYGSISEAATAASNLAVPQSPAVAAALAGITGLDSRTTQRVLIAASPAQNNATFNRNLTGWSTRANLSMDVASNTAWGPLIGHFTSTGRRRTASTPYRTTSMSIPPT